MKKFLLIFLSLAVIIMIVAPVKNTDSKIKSYYSGDALAYNGKTIIASTNTGKLEIFTVDLKKGIERFVALRSFDRRFGTETDFLDVLLNIEDGSLYAYAVDGRTFVKYDISNLSSAREVARAEDTSWDFFGGLEKIDGYIATVGTNGIKLWTGNLLVKDQYKVTTPGVYTFNSTSATSEKYIFTVADNKISIFNRELRETLNNIPLAFTWAGKFYKRAVYNDHDQSSLYVVDDSAVRKFNFNGEIERSFDHTGTAGYDIIPSLDENYLYFSDGIGLVKLRKSDFKVMNFVYTQNLGNGGGWATGLKVIRDGNGNEQVVLFNTTGILVFNSQLKPLKTSQNQVLTVAASEIDSSPTITEPVFLKVDKNRGAAGSIVFLHGGGYAQNEPLTIEFADTTTIVNTNENGSFSLTLTVPQVTHRDTDIKVTGHDSGIKYNVGFHIE
jgi:hypothetical protein